MAIAHFSLPQGLSLAQFKAQALSVFQDHHPLLVLDNNEFKEDVFHELEWLLAAGAVRQVRADRFGPLEEAMQAEPKAWWLGYFAYELKNDLEDLSSEHIDPLGFPKLAFFQPAVRVLIRPNGEIEIEAEDPQAVWENCLGALALLGEKPEDLPELWARISKAEYMATIGQLKEHILAGDIYEVNFCQEFLMEGAKIAPLGLYQRLMELSPSPFAAYYQWGEDHLISASPERFLAQRGRRLIAQPIKGTIGRGETLEEDLALAEALRASEKDLAEHVMIVDLLRNDLAQSAEPATVEVSELFGIYAFPQLQQMISTVEAERRLDCTPLAALKKAFPMGSMTGAPKIMSMKIIERYERQQRGLYSGAVGYFSPEGNSDFNVVIRTLLYQKEKGYLSFQVGGAIVYDSVAEAEYEECLLKAKGLLLALGKKL
ncbi:anthranilate synthase component I family protein [Saprospira sp. CCB-QB6]|uniref:anthranilate synthase component I family protein n=1 Tax=Saprospira sp. CCB-QB6 TaxID=3023936 RepID=UPI002349EE4A|nr:anthranilate synthase component I family protein [Saprospira sp. CCB-QB6]WCL81086.1 anthranilate synthase component I family protein [Saprospira sp. CCB-QB6]